jgi:hypothetical protein
VLARIVYREKFRFHDRYIHVSIHLGLATAHWYPMDTGKLKSSLNMHRHVAEVKPRQCLDFYSIYVSILRVALRLLSCVDQRKLSVFQYCSNCR